MQLEKRLIEAALSRKGFEANEGDHHYFVYHSSNGIKTAVRTKTSHGSGAKSIGDGLIKLMARQCKISKDEFVSLVQCSLSREQYEALLLDRGAIRVKK